ncbi:flagellar basal body P-ring formation chaperone FlgA [Simiduia curdlanivorans]|uniref:Flagella basal body P-ring formation protein FlgA n=1 Tax=Simiduia curdlanivorans TaxID=1492769 RepID=A0ABV8V1H0_9GAMM|nr:flagellar basal body P-ring formation chaperone FlgA [Simiduia curdlanivorans]MDN3639966.1 flagellar basal body P-ring formation chaperone FlgA [Simiduia curdlanivorans]
MKLLLGLLSALFILFTSSPSGGEERWHPIDNIAKTVDTALASHYLGLYPNYDIKITVNAPDNRLKFHQCDKQLTVDTQNLPASGGNATAQVKCAGHTPWSLYVSATIEIWGNAVTANTSIARGQVIDESSLTLARTNIASIRKGSLLSIEDAEGLEARRAIRPHQVVRSQDLIEPLVIRKGDAVQVAALLGSLRVITPGTALGNGRVGEHISVTNNRSNRKVRAKVIAEGLVEVPL